MRTHLVFLLRMWNLGLVVYVFLPSSTLHLLFSLLGSHTSNSNSVGCNCLYGTSHCKSYSSDHIAIGNLSEKSTLVALSALISATVNRNNCIS